MQNVEYSGQSLRLFHLNKRLSKKRPFFFSISLFCNSHACICNLLQIEHSFALWGNLGYTVTHLIYVFSSLFEITMKLMKMTVLIAFSREGWREVTFKERFSK